jgi:hypothetical protein
VVVLLREVLLPFVAGMVLAYMAMPPPHNLTMNSRRRIDEPRGLGEAYRDLG